MSKKRQRISYLVGIRNALNDCEETPTHDDCYLYEKSKIKQILATVDHLLREDGITPLNADSKARGES